MARPDSSVFPEQSPLQPSIYMYLAVVSRHTHTTQELWTIIIANVICLPQTQTPAATQGNKQEIHTCTCTCMYTWIFLSLGTTVELVSALGCMGRVVRSLTHHTSSQGWAPGCPLHLCFHVCTVLGVVD